MQLVHVDVHPLGMLRNLLRTQWRRLKSFGAKIATVAGKNVSKQYRAVMLSIPCVAIIFDIPFSRIENEPMASEHLYSDR